MRRAADRSLGALFALSFSALALTGLLYLCVCLPGGMAFLMTRFAPPEATGLPAADYLPLCRMICGYLQGRLPAFSYAPEGVELFHGYEAAHMADCRALFALDRTVLLAAALLCALSALLLTLRRGWRPARGGVRLGAGLVLLAVAALALWGLIDFNTLFTGFHRLMFTNDLWLLNPATDLLIRLMPLPFFIAIAAGIAVLWLILTALPLLLSLRRPGGRRKS